MLGKKLIYIELSGTVSPKAGLQRGVVSPGWSFIKGFTVLSL